LKFCRVSPPCLVRARDGTWVRLANNGHRLYRIRIAGVGPLCTTLSIHYNRPLVTLQWY
jgi:hypothetical protein